jgi:hypothetical protein
VDYTIDTSEFYKDSDTQTLGIDLGQVRGIRACDPAAHIGVAADRRGKGEAPALVIQRLEDEDEDEDEDVGQVHECMPPSNGSFMMKTSSGRMSLPQWRIIDASAVGTEPRWPCSVEPCTTSGGVG